MFGANECDNVTAPAELSFTTATLSALVTCSAIPGNLLVILAVLIDPNKDLKSPFNFLVTNLAVADLLVGCLVGPLSIARHIREGLGHKLRAGAEASLHMSFFISCTASLLSLTALTIDRYLAITSPLEYRMKLSPRRIIFVSAGIWLFSLTFPFVYFQVGFIAYTFVFANTAVAATFAVLLFTYVKIFQTFRAQVQEWDQLSEPGEDNGLRKRAVKWEKKITKTFLIMLALFISCYLPSCIMIYVLNLCTHCDCVSIHVLRDMQLLFIMANSSMNPLVYACRLKTFRKAYRQIFVMIAKKFRP